MTDITTQTLNAGTEQENTKINVGIVGATGYAGLELLRLLIKHPNVNIKVITSRSEEGTVVSSLLPNLRGLIDLKFDQSNSPLLKECDLVFFATPHGVAMSRARELLDNGVRVIDLSADFRIKNKEVFKDWYGLEHECPDLLEEAVYGLPELNRKDIKNARIIANPGCYPTAVQLGFAPLLKHKLISSTEHLIANCVSGVSGAGRSAKIGSLFTEVSDNFKAYGILGHRHSPEINQQLQLIEPQAKVLFMPHLMPAIRGIHATLYARLNETGRNIDLYELYKTVYNSEAFIDVMPEGSTPETRSVKASNLVRIAISKPQTDMAVILVVEDNLVKGAAGQAVQCMNLMFAFPEVTALDQVPILP
ncbi:MAG: N-acetyl-gamma-glutamyl-phosphate reductase [Saezia sp.]